MMPKTKDKALSDIRSTREIERRRMNREAILHAAEAMIIRKGLNAASMDDVAAEAGFSKATLYKYVRGKSELVFELLIHFMEDLDAGIKPIVEGPLKPEAKLLALLRTILRFQVEKENISRTFLLDPFSFRMLHVMTGDKEHPATQAERDFLRRLYSAREAVLGRVEAFLREGIKTGAFRPISLDSGIRFLSAVIQGYQHDNFSLKTKPDLEKDVSDIYAFLLRGLASGN